MFLRDHFIQIEVNVITSKYENDVLILFEIQK